jgi:hypothetical protein
MRFASFVVGLVVLAVPSVAFAEWRLVVSDMKTHEVRTFAPPAGKTYAIPMALDGWACELQAERTDKGITHRRLHCRLGKAAVVVNGSVGHFGAVRLYNGDGEGWYVEIFGE